MIWIITAIIATTLIAGLLFLPSILLRSKLNRTLRNFETLSGSVAQARVNLFSSTAIITDLRLEHRNSLPEQPPIAHIPYMRVSFRWKALLRKTFDLNIRVENPLILLTAREGDAIANMPETPTALPASFKNTIEPLSAFRIDLEVFNGAFNYTNAAANPAADLTISDLHLRLQDFTNRGDATHISPVHASGMIYNGKIALQANLHPLADTLTFDLNAAVRGVELPLLNNYLRRFAHVDVSAGTLDLYAELAVTNHVFQGQLTPILKNLDFRNATDRHDSFLQKVWERTVATGIRLLAKQRQGEIATSIPIHGTLDNPNINLAAAIVGVFRNAFVRSIIPSLTHIVSLGTLSETARTTTVSFVRSLFKKRERA
jgi:hypothetical protein